MRSRRWIAVLLFACGCGLGLEGDPDGGNAAPQPGPTAEAQAWVDAHNAVRRDARPPPSPHNAGRGDRGENIAASAPANRWSLADAVAAWAGEAQDYDYATNGCAPGKQCGHYTQIVWRDTLRVGCAHRACDTNSPFGAQLPSWDFWVCDYEPPGNFVGRRPY